MVLLKVLQSGYIRILDLSCGYLYTLIYPEGAVDLFSVLWQLTDKLLDVDEDNTKTQKSTYAISRQS